MVTWDEENRIDDALRHIDAHDRDTWVRMGMAVKSELGEAGFELWDAWSQSASNYDARAARDVWRSIQPDGKVSIGSLFYAARANGWRDTQPPQQPAAVNDAERMDTARKAMDIWGAASAAGAGHPYLKRKGVAPVPTLREIEAERAVQILGYTPKARGEPLAGRLLVVPVKQGDKLATLELIDEAGRKSALAGRGTKAGGYWATAKLPQDDGATLLIGEGVATVASASEATGHVGIAALTCTNLQSVARAMRQRYPSADIIVLADIDKASDEPIRHAVEAARAAGARLAVPNFGGDRAPEDTDFNDLHQRKGLEAVRCCIEAAAPAPTGTLPPVKEADAIEPVPLSEALARARQILLPCATHEGLDAYPVDALGPMAAACRAIAEGAQVQPGLVGQSLLATAALLASPVFNLRHIDGSTKPLALYCLTVALSGSGKDVADGIATYALRKWQRKANADYKDAMATYEAAKASRKKGEQPPEQPIAPHRVCNDLTVEGLRRAFGVGVASQGVFSTEGAAVLAGHGFSDDHRAKSAAVLCGLWDRGEMSVLRAGDGRFERYGLRLSAHLLIQPAAVADVLHDPLLGDIGLWPRFLLAWPPVNPPRRFKLWDYAEHPAVAAYWRTCTDLLALPVPDDCTDLHALELAPEARQALGAFFEAMEREAAGRLAGVRPFALRATEQAARIAGVLSVWQGMGRIGLAEVEGGIELARYSVQQWHEALCSGKADPATDRALSLYRWLADRPGRRASLTDILRSGPRSLRAKDARNEAAERLESAGLLARAGDTLQALGIAQGEPPAKVAKAAKSLEPQGFRGGECVANDGENWRTDGERFAAIRHDSPAVRHGGSLEPQGFSPDSPDSPAQGGTSPAEPGGDDEVEADA